jgi:hypothetical protein
MLTRAVDTNTFELAEGSLQARAWAAAPAETDRARAAAVKAAAKECGEGRMAAAEEEESMERKWKSAAWGRWRESGLMREFHEATSRVESGMSAKTANAAGRRGRGREE